TPPELWGPHNREALVRGVRRRGLVGFADCVLVHSRYTRHELQQSCKVVEERLLQLGYAGCVRPGPNASNNNALRRKLGLQRATVLLYVGRLAPNKRVPLLVEALDRLRHLEPPVHLLLAGDDRDLYQAEAELCRAKAGKLDLA